MNFQETTAVELVAKRASGINAAIAAYMTACPGAAPVEWDGVMPVYQFLEELGDKRRTWEAAIPDDEDDPDGDPDSDETFFGLMRRQTLAKWELDPAVAAKRDAASEAERLAKLAPTDRSWLKGVREAYRKLPDGRIEVTRLDDDGPATSLDDRASDQSALVDPGERPVIQFMEAELPSMVNAAAAALVNSGAPIYARGTSLVLPVRMADVSVKSSRVKRDDAATILVPLEEAGLVEKLTAQALWLKFSRQRMEWEPAACPPIVAKTLIARRGDWPFPQLRAVISAPTLRPDGSILSTKGFDHETGLLFASDLNWPTIPDAPSQEDAEAALSRLADVISTFPFASDADSSAALAMILTALARTSLPAAPLFGVNAPTPGTGKSKLIDIAAILATGHAASVMRAPSNEDELQKHIAAALMEGDTFLTLDNVEYPLRSEFLCQVLTQGSVSVRVLGESRRLHLPTCVSLAATGNSLRVAGDLTRRTVLINLDAKMERPEERTFKTDAIDIAKARRADLVTAGLTVLRAFIVNRGPKIIPALGGFEAWSNLVRSALQWLGEADPLANAEKVRDRDPERERTMAVLNALPRETQWSVADIARWIEGDRQRADYERQYEALTEALSEFVERGNLNRQRFGKFLQKHVDRIVDGRRIVRSFDAHRRVGLWSVEVL